MHLVIYALLKHSITVYDHNCFLIPIHISKSGVCHSRERIGYKISQYSTSSKTRIGSVKDCSQECQRDSTCNSFSYRSVSSS